MDRGRDLEMSEGEELRRCRTVGWSMETKRCREHAGGCKSVVGPALALALALAVLSLLVFSPVATASKTVVNTLGNAPGVGSVQGSGITGGLFNTPRGVAVNSTGA